MKLVRCLQAGEPSTASTARNSRSRRRWLALAAIPVAVAVPALSASTASAAFHLIKVREVYAGSSEEPGSQYVQLQAYARGQQFVSGHSVKTYGPSGGETGTNTFSSNVDDGSNQMTILLATPQAESEFGVSADSPMSSGQLSPSGGAVCFESIDCVAWGSFEGSLGSPTGDPAESGGIPDGMALRRTIEPNCPTLLEAADDRNDSARDFFPAFPDPRPNSAAPTEKPCPPPGQSEPGDTGDEPAPDDSGPAPGTAPGTAFAARTALARGRIGVLRLLCRGQQGARCRGILRLYTRVRIGRADRTRTRTILIGAARYNLPAVQQLHRVRFRLTPAGARLLHRSTPRGLRSLLAGPGLRNRLIRLRPPPGSRTR